MDFRQYVDRQKELIKNSRRGEEFLIINGEAIPLRPADEVLGELNVMDGLFADGRGFYSFSRETVFAV